MVTIGRIPTLFRSFFQPRRRRFRKQAWPHFYGLVLAIAMATEHTVERLNALLRLHTHRTNDGEFLWRSEWDESWVLREIALDTLKRLRRKSGKGVKAEKGSEAISRTGQAIGSLLRSWQRTLDDTNIPGPDQASRQATDQPTDRRTEQRINERTE